MIVLTEEEDIRFFQLLTRRSALKLEMKGIKRRGRTVYSICKEVYKLKGNKAKVLAQLEEMIDEVFKRRET